MNANRDPETILAAWLDEGPTDLPDAMRRAILTALPTTSQARRSPLAPWRFFQMNTYARLAAAALVAVVAVGGALYLLRGNGGVGSEGPTPTSTLAPSPSVGQSSLGPIDTSTWTTYTSTRYQFSVGHPADWPEVPATRIYLFPADAGQCCPPPGTETFHTPADDVGISAWSVAAAPGSTMATWLQAYCSVVEATTCTALQSRTIAVSMDGHAGSLVAFQGDTQAFFLIGTRMYVVGCWRSESDPSVLPYGGATRLLEGFLSTMHLLPGGSAPAPS